MENKKEKIVAYTFSDVLIVPKYSEIQSRKNVDISSSFGGKFTLKLPLLAANMKTICGPKMAIAAREFGAMGILHRFCPIEQAIKDFLEVKHYFNSKPTLKDNITTNNEHYIAGVSIGVQEDDKIRFDKLYQDAGARLFCLDVAHGHHINVKKMLTWINHKNLGDIYIIAGNVATGEGAYDVASWGANAVKIGVGPGAACMTRKFTGCGTPMLYALSSVKDEFEKQGVKNVQVVSDGGITDAGSFCKAMKFANACMVGSLISGTSECPGSVFKDENEMYYKVYSGSSSGEHKLQNNNTVDFVEGITKKIQFRGHVKYIFAEVEDGLRSSFSYVGANNLQEFQEKCEFIEISDGGRVESKI